MKKIKCKLLGLLTSTLIGCSTIGPYIEKADYYQDKSVEYIMNNKFSNLFAVETVEEKIIGKDEKKELKDTEKKRNEYKIEKINFDEKESLLNLYVIKNSYLDIFNEGFTLTRDKFEVKTKKENYFGALPLGIGGILGVTGLTMVIQYLATDVSKGCPDGGDYPMARKQCINEREKQRQSYLNLSFIPLGLGGIFSGAGAYLLKENKRVSYKDEKEELRNPVVKNVKELKESKLINKKPADNLKLNIENELLYFDNEKKEIEILADKGEVYVEIKPINEKSFLKKDDFFKLKQIKDLKFLGLEEDVKKAYNNLASEKVSIIITTEAKDGKDDGVEFKLNLYKLGNIEDLFK